MEVIKYRQRVRVQDGTYFWHYWGLLSHGKFTSPILNDLNDPSESQQYIGRKDKNGIEIYEGDIFPIYFKGERKIQIKGYCWIYWRESYLQYEMHDTLGNEEYNIGWFAENSSVIGNIYENHNLLEK